MSDSYSFKEVHITLQPGVVLVAQVEDIAALKKILKDLQTAQIFSQQTAEDFSPKIEKSEVEDSPERRIEIKSELSSGKISSSNILAFKDNVPELPKASALSVTDAVLILLFALETGLKKSRVDYETFKALYEAQNIKSGSPLAMLITNLKNSSYIDKKIYSDEKNLRLTAKGEKQAIEALKKAIKN
jgi:hypothetical protein